MEQQDLDQFPGAFGIPVDPSGVSPEFFMGTGESPRLPCPGQSRGARKCGPRLRFQDSEVVIQLDRVAAPGSDPVDGGQPVSVRQRPSSSEARSDTRTLRPMNRARTECFPVRARHHKA